VTLDRLRRSDSWALDPALAYLNHGAFGATPRAVLDVQSGLRAALEANPADFYLRRLRTLLTEVRSRLATFLRTTPDSLVFVENATTGTQTALGAVPLGPGDEVVCTDHIYPAVLVQLRREAARRGFEVVVAHVPIEVEGPGDVAAAVIQALGPRAKLLLVDQIASPTGLVFPIRDLAAECRRRGITILVDGAHAPGSLELDLDDLGVDFWTGNLHKWVCSPKSAAVLYAAPDRRADLHPLVASHDHDAGYQPGFDWTGTRDPTALLSAPAAIDLFAAAGWPEVRRHNAELAGRGAALVADRFGAAVPFPDPDLTAGMRLVALPRELDADEARSLERRLLDEYAVVVPVMFFQGWRWVRVSGQLYNTLDDYRRLADALEACLA